jgi:hypothetical protein
MVFGPKGSRRAGVSAVTWSVPDRRCNGGPNGAAWCGRPAAYVAHDEEGLGWFCCGPAHAEGCGSRPGTTLEELEPWLAAVEERVLAEDVVRRLSGREPGQSSGSG